MTRPVLELAEVEKRRERAGVAFELTVPALSLSAGTFAAVVGESGCGKSTLLDLLALVLRPTTCGAFHLYPPVDAGASGPVDIAALWQAGDEAALAAYRREQLGYVLQTGGLFPFLTVRGNILLSARLKGERIGPDRLAEQAARIGIAEHLAKKPRYLSGGQRQRVAILRAILHRPRLVLADEPTAAVDKARARAIVEDLHGLARDQGTTIVMVTHDQGLVMDLADEVYGFTVEAVDDVTTRSRCTRLR